MVTRISQKPKHMVTFDNHYNPFVQSKAKVITEIVTTKKSIGINRFIDNLYLPKGSRKVKEFKIGGYNFDLKIIRPDGTWFLVDNQDYGSYHRYGEHYQCDKKRIDFCAEHGIEYHIVPVGAGGLSKIKNVERANQEYNKKIQLIMRGSKAFQFVEVFTSATGKLTSVKWYPEYDTKVGNAKQIRTFYCDNYGRRRSCDTTSPFIKTNKKQKIVKVS